VVCGVLTSWWAQGMIVLIRPAFTWVDTFPNTASFSQASIYWPWLVAAAMMSALARVIGEDLVLRRSPRADAMVRAYRRRWLQLPRRGPLTDRLPPPLRAVLVVGMIALALSGTYTSWVDAAVVIVVSTCVKESECLPTAQPAVAAAGAAVAAALLALGHSAGVGSDSEAKEPHAGSSTGEATGGGEGAGSGIELFADLLTDDIPDLFVDLAKDTRQDAESEDSGDDQPGT